MQKVLITILAKSPPTAEAVVRKYGLRPSDVDAEFGIVAVDPDHGAYTVLVNAAKAHLIVSDDEWTVEGPFSNPKIGPFGVD